MDLNATLLGQMITFAVFVWFTMKFVWPTLEKTLRERQQKIAEGLAAAQRGHVELELAKKYAVQHIHETKKHALEIIEQAKKQALLLMEEAQKQASIEREQSKAASKAAAAQERLMIEKHLKTEFAKLLTVSTEKLLSRVLTEQDQKTLLSVDPDVHDE